MPSEGPQNAATVARGFYHSRSGRVKLSLAGLPPLGILEAMDASEAAKLRSEWGDKPCTHESAAREFGPDGPTGDYACQTCGQTWWQQAGWEQARKAALEKYGSEKP